MDCIIIGGNQMIHVTKAMKEGEILELYSTSPHAQEKLLKYIQHTKGIELVPEEEALSTGTDREIKETLEYYKPLKVAN